jgi:hypothetical protein
MRVWKCGKSAATTVLLVINYGFANVIMWIENGIEESELLIFCLTTSYFKNIN